MARRSRFEEAAARFESVVARRPAGPVGWRAMVGVRDVRAVQGNVGVAERWAADAVGVAHRVFGGSHPLTVASWMEWVGLCVAAGRAGRLVDAAEFGDQAGLVPAPADRGGWLWAAAETAAMVGLGAEMIAEPARLWGLAIPAGEVVGCVTAVRDGDGVGAELLAWCDRVGAPAAVRSAVTVRGVQDGSIPVEVAAGRVAAFLPDRVAVLLSAGAVGAAADLLLGLAAVGDASVLAVAAVAAQLPDWFGAAVAGQFDAAGGPGPAVLLAVLGAYWFVGRDRGVEGCAVLVDVLGRPGLGAWHRVALLNALVAVTALTQPAVVGEVLEEAVAAAAGWANSTVEGWESFVGLTGRRARWLAAQPTPGDVLAGLGSLVEPWQIRWWGPTGLAVAGGDELLVARWVRTAVRSGDPAAAAPLTRGRPGLLDEVRAAVVERGGIPA